jgi:hypothetical protein
MAGIYREQPGWFVSKNFESTIGDSGAAVAVAETEFWSDDFRGRAKIEFTLKDAAGDLVASTSVKYAIFDYKTGSPLILEWMKPVYRGLSTTNGAGLFSVNYPGVSPVGDLAYVAIITATESFIYPIPVSYG